MSVCLTGISSVSQPQPSACFPSPSWISSASSNHLVAETQQITSEPS